MPGSRYPVFVLKALSLPQEAKTTHGPGRRSGCLSWLMRLQPDISWGLGFGINNHFYKRLDQINKTDIEFLAWRCSLEGYSLKVTDKTIVIFDERTMEKSSPVKTIYHSDFDGDYIFGTNPPRYFPRAGYNVGRSEWRPGTVQFMVQ